MITTDAVETLLNQQLERLAELHQLLVTEQAILIERRLDELADIPPQKTKILLQLQKGDQALAHHDLAAGSNPIKVEQAKSQLGLCKRLNEENGRMISLAMNSIGKIRNMMAQAGQQQATTTYTSEGKTNTLNSSGNSISV